MRGASPLPENPRVTPPLARPDANSEMLGIGGLIMADNLEYILSRERERGKVLVFAASGHLKKSGRVQWLLAENEGAAKEWWPAGTQLNHTLGSCYSRRSQRYRYVPLAR